MINWYLYEIGVDFNDVDIASVDRSGPAYPHPFGKIPACRDGPLAVFESGAILMYIADKYGGLDTPEKRAAAGSWVVWANATLDPICFIENDRGQVMSVFLALCPLLWHVVVSSNATLHIIDRGPMHLCGTAYCVRFCLHEPLH